MDTVILHAQNGPVQIDRYLLVSSSKLFQSDDVVSDPIKEVQLKDFKQETVELFRDFAQTFHLQDLKIPTNVESEHFAEQICCPAAVKWIERLTTSQLYELLFLSNYMECRLLFELCSFRIACWMMIRQNAAMCSQFNVPLCRPTIDYVKSLSCSGDGADHTSKVCH
jgi:hypothetical protein